MVYRIQYTTPSALRRAGDVEDAGWADVPGLFENEKEAREEAASLEAAVDRRFAYRVVPYDLVRAA